MEEKAKFDNENNTLILFIGKSPIDYFQKWEIHLVDLDPYSIKLDDSEFSGNKVTVFTNNNQDKIEYFKEGTYISSSSQTNYYLGFCWSKPQEKQYFVESFRRAIILSKKQ